MIQLFSIKAIVRITLTALCCVPVWTALARGGDPLVSNPLVAPGGWENRRPTAERNDTIPADFPSFQIQVFDNPAPGKIFMCPFLRATPRYTYLTILDENITPSYYSRRPESMNDFKLQPNGLITFFDTRTRCFYVMNSNYAIIDSFRCGNGYLTDGHDFQMLPNGRALLMSYDSRIVDMSVIVPGGNPAASVAGLIIQELDANKLVVFQWSSWDHFAITDATHENLTAATIDYVHGNAFEFDHDGNIMLSSRNMDEITKIDRSTGEIIWRLGGINNQFVFINDSSSTTIRYGLPHTSFVTLTVYNALGQQVAQPVNEQQQAGYHDVVFRGDGLASGVYFYRIQAVDFVASRKLLFLK